VHWLGDVDGARRYLAGKPADAPIDPRLKPSRKAVYNMVTAGLRVARLGDIEPTRDTKGRLRHGRMMFAAEWVDEFLEARAPQDARRVKRLDAA
jgi:hypothetical protein